MTIDIWKVAALHLLYDTRSGDKQMPIFTVAAPRELSWLDLMR